MKSGKNISINERTIRTLRVRLWIAKILEKFGVNESGEWDCINIEADILDKVNAPELTGEQPYLVWQALNNSSEAKLLKEWLKHILKNRFVVSRLLVTYCRDDETEVEPLIHISSYRDEQTACRYKYKWDKSKLIENEGFLFVKV